MGKTDYNLRDLESDDLFKLLPQVVQTIDSGVFKALLDGGTHLHNIQLERNRTLPRLVDPFKGYVGTPASLGEDAEIFKTWLGLFKKSSRSKNEEKQLKQIATKVPKSIREYKLGAFTLGLLLKQVGFSGFDQSPSYQNRTLASYAYRLHNLKGSSEYVNLLSIISSMFDMKIKGIWTDFTSRSQALIGSPYPFLNQLGVKQSHIRGRGLIEYESFEDVQYPKGSDDYNQSLDDGGGTETYDFSASPVNSLEKPYSLVRCPFGKFEGAVSDYLIPGEYRLAGGSQSARAFASIKSKNGDTNTFVCGFYGEAGNKVSVSIEDGEPFYQNITITGPDSQIKFKSSYLSSVCAVDLSLLPAKEVLSLDDLISASLQFSGLIEESIPLTRTIVNRTFGVSSLDTVRYAPYQYVDKVILESPSGDSWKLVIESGFPKFIRSSEGATADIIVQMSDSGLVKWGVSDLGLLKLQTPPNGVGESIVYIESDSGKGFVVLRAGGLTFSKTPPTELVEDIHGDANKELALLDHLAFVTEVDQDGKEESKLGFQSSPEDELVQRNFTFEQSRSHLGIPFGEREVSGFLEKHISLLNDGRTKTNDIRYRFAGITDSITQPTPTGQLTFGPVIEFLNYHGLFVWREPISNIAYKCYYTEETEDPEAGGELVIEALGGDGPIEGTAVGPLDFGSISHIGNGCTPNSQIAANYDQEWERYKFIEVPSIEGRIIDNHSDECSDFPLGASFFAEEDLERLVHTGNGGLEGATIDDAKLWHLSSPIHCHGNEKIRLSFTAKAGIEWMIIKIEDDDSRTILFSDVSSGDADVEYSLEPDSRIEIASRGVYHTLVASFDDLIPPTLGGVAMARGMERDCLSVEVIEDESSSSSGV